MKRPALGYYGAMASTAVVAAVLAVVSSFSAGQWTLLPDVLTRIAVLIAGVNLAGAVAIFAPIRRFLDGDRARRDAALRRIGALPAISGFWVGALVFGTMLSHAAAVQGSWSALLQSPSQMLAATLVHSVGLGVYLGLYAYFVVVDFSVRLRQRLWAMGEALVARRGKLLYRLAGAMSAVALAPALVLFSDQWSRPALEMPMRMAMARHEAYMRQALHMDVFAALLLLAVVIWLVARGLSRPIEVLLGAMRRVDRGDLRAKAPVVSDDEFGLLSEQFNRMLAGLEERDRIRRTFARFVPERVAASLLAKEGAIASQEREATVLFADIESFTAIASRLAPGEIVHMLNDYFSEVAHIIHRHSGVITQFQGDAVLATFNIPAADPDHARHALQAALEIQARLAETTFAPGIRLRARVGISTGPVVGGTVGGDDRLGYTVHGDTVNLAARLEALNKDLGTGILLSARTAELLAGSVPLRDCGAVPVRGFPESQRVFEPLAGDAAEAKQSEEKDGQEAL